MVEPSPVRDHHIGRALPVTGIDDPRKRAVPTVDVDGGVVTHGVSYYTSKHGVSVVSTLGRMEARYLSSDLQGFRVSDR